MRGTWRARRAAMANQANWPNFYFKLVFPESSVSSIPTLFQLPAEGRGMKKQVIDPALFLLLAGNDIVEQESKSADGLNTTDAQHYRIRMRADGSSVRQQ